MVIEKQKLSQMIRCAAQELKLNCEYLSQIDSRFGDGDHGITIGRIADIMEKEVDEWENQSIKEFLDELASAIMNVNGGSAGPLWGTLIGGLAIPLEGKTDVDGTTLKAMLCSSLNEMEDITTARIGDKTMMDTLIPAVEQAQNAQDEVEAVLRQAAEGAQRGAKATENFIAKFGRAKSYKEQTIGTPDAGAVSLSILFKAFAAACHTV